MADYPKELTELVDEFLTDGIISDKERQVLLRKAENLGIDRDEFDLYIDAQQQKVDQTIEDAASKKRGKTCPFCGGTLPLLVDKCPHCGQTVTVEASEELQEIFDNLEKALVDLKSGKDTDRSKATVELYIRKANLYYGGNPKVQKLISEFKDESDRANNKARKKAIVSVLSHNKYLVLGVVLGLVAVISLGIWRLCQGPDLEDPTIVTEFINDAIEQGDFEKAETYIVNASYSVKKRIQSSIISLAKAYVDNNEFAKALKLKTYIDLDDIIVYTTDISEKLIIKGQYDMALDLWERYSSTRDPYSDYLLKCVSHMVSCNEAKSTIKYFILNKVERVHWGIIEDTDDLKKKHNEKREDLKNRLFEVADIKDKD